MGVAAGAAVADAGEGAAVDGRLLMIDRDSGVGGAKRQRKGQRVTTRGELRLKKTTP